MEGSINRRVTVQYGPGKKQAPTSKITTVKRARVVAQTVPALQA
jgi:hypothetical protein